MAARGLVNEGPAPQEWEGFSFIKYAAAGFGTPMRNRTATVRTGI